MVQAPTNSLGLDARIFQQPENLLRQIPRANVGVLDFIVVIRKSIVATYRKSRPLAFSSHMPYQGVTYS